MLPAGCNSNQTRLSWPEQEGVGSQYPLRADIHEEAPSAGNEIHGGLSGETPAGLPAAFWDGPGQDALGRWFHLFALPEIRSLGVGGPAQCLSSFETTPPIAAGRTFGRVAHLAPLPDAAAQPLYPPLSR